MKKVLVLYSELAGYFMACLRQLVADGSIEVHVVRWPVHPDAPFVFKDEPGIFLYERKEMDLKAIMALADKLQPQGVYVTGWIDKTYVQAAKQLRRRQIPVVAAFDTHWKGTSRQKMAVALSPFLIRPAFSHCWVPGLYQYEYARRLGYPRERIYTGMYAADTGLFKEQSATRLKEKSESYPNRFLYVGRLVESKGIKELIEAYISLYQEGNKDWKLLLVGNGPLRDSIPAHPGIEVQGFVQPHELPQLADQAGCFVLPSRDEPWGLVVHEFASAGLPLILSDQVGAHTAFLRPGYNGFLAKAGNVASMRTALLKMMQRSLLEKLEMGSRSAELSLQISPQTWSTTLREILNLD